MTTLDVLINQFDNLDDQEQCAFIKMLRNKRQLNRKAKYDKIVNDVKNGNCISGIDNIFKELDEEINSARA